MDFGQHGAGAASHIFQLVLGSCSGAFRPRMGRNSRCHSAFSSYAPSLSPASSKMESGARPTMAPAGAEVDVAGLLGRGAARP
eukprot:3359892-Pyramimonas_sp.AAC.1